MKMYDTFYDLKRRPFSLMPDPEFFYFSRSCRIALSLLEVSVTNRVALTVLLGSEGIGKTSVIRHFADQQPNEYMVGIVTAVSGQTTEEFLGGVLEIFGILELRRPQRDVLGQWNDLVSGNINDGRRRMLVVDDAEQMSFETINILLGFVKKDSDDLDGVQIILSGHSKLTESFKYSHIESWINAAGLSYRIQPLRRQETVEYIRYRLVTAGSERGDIFDPSALDAMFDYSEGVPQRINFLCDSVLDYGRAEKEGVINRFWVDKTVAKWNESRVKDPIGMEGVGHAIAYEDSKPTLVKDNVTSTTDEVIPLDVFDTLSDPQEKSGKSRASKQPPTTFNTQNTDYAKIILGEFAKSPPITRSATAQKAMVAFFILLGSGIVWYWANVNEENSVASSSVALVTEETTLIESDLGGESVADTLDTELSAIESDDLIVEDDETEFFAFIPADKDPVDTRIRSGNTKPSMDIQNAPDVIVKRGGELKKRSSKKAIHNPLKEKQIQALLNRGKRQLQLLQLTHPKGSNAYETYSKILKIEPNDDRGTAGLQRVAGKYLVMAKYYLAKERYQRSYNLVKKGLAIVPQDRKLLEMEKRVAASTSNSE